MQLTAAEAQRFRAKVAPPDANGCCLWQGAIDKNSGYGRFRAAGRIRVAHRVAWALAGREVPPDRELDHLCRVRACVTESHLEAVTHAENVRRGDLPRVTRLRGATSLTCRQGHPWSEQEPLFIGGTRTCRVCRNANQRARWQKRTPEVILREQEAHHARYQRRRRESQGTQRL